MRNKKKTNMVLLGPKIPPVPIIQPPSARFLRPHTYNIRCLSPWNVMKEHFVRVMRPKGGSHAGTGPELAEPNCFAAQRLFWRTKSAARQGGLS